MQTRPAKKSDWQVEPMPEKQVTVRVDRTFTKDEMKAIKMGFVPKVQEEKWFVFMEGDELFFHRSWTGYMTYKIKFDGDRMVEVVINRDPEQYSQTDNGLDVEILMYLIDLLLLRRQPESPNRADDEDGALWLWSLVGSPGFGLDHDDSLGP